jgi:hypothetical protein
MDLCHATSADNLADLIAIAEHPLRRTVVHCHVPMLSGQAQVSAEQPS